MSEETDHISAISGHAQPSKEDLFAREVSAIIAWSNTFLKQRDMHAESLVDFGDGVLLINLLEVAFREKVGTYTLRTKLLAHKLDNMAIAFQFLRDHGVQLISIDVNDIIKAKPKATLNVLWNLLRTLTIRGLKLLVGEVDAAGNPTGASGTNVRDTLLKWIDSSFDDVADVEVTDFWESFRDGKAFCAIVENLVPGSINVADLKEEDAQQNIALAFKVAEEELGIPSLLQPDDFLYAKGDEKAVENYMCMLVSASQGKAKTEAEVTALKEKMEEKQAKKQREVEALRQQVEEEKQQHASLLADLEALRVSHTEAFQSEQELQKRLEVADEEREVFSSKIANVCAELEKSHASLQEAHNREQKLIDNSATLESKVREQDEELQKRNDEVTALQSQIYQLHKEQENMLRNVRSEMRQAAIEERSHVTEESKDSLADMLGAAIRERKGYNDFLNAMRVKRGWLMKRRPGKSGKKLFGGTDYKKRFFELKGDCLYYYVDDKGGKEKGKALLKHYTKIEFLLPAENNPDIKLMEDYDKSAQKIRSSHNIRSESSSSIDSAASRGRQGSVVENASGPVLRLVPISGHENSNTAKIMELQAIDTMVLEQREDIFSWIEEINTRIALINYLEIMFEDSVRAKGSREVVEFIINPKNTNFVLENKMTDLHEAFTHFKESLILRKDLSITLNNVALSDPAVDIVSEIVARNHTLEELELPRNMITQVGAEFIAEAIRRNPKLSVLNLNGNSIKDEGIIKIADALKGHRYLRDIRVRDNQITDVGAVVLINAMRVAAKTFPANPWLKIDLGRNMIGDETAFAVCEVMKSHEALLEVILENNLITDVGGRDICKATRDPVCRCRVINLAHNQISSQTVAEAAETIKSVKRPVSFVLSGNPLITADGVQKLVATGIPLEFKELSVSKHADSKP